MMNLTGDDLIALTQEPSAAVRDEICAKLCNAYNAREFSERELEVATEIIRLLSKDASQRVRKTLASHLCYNSEVPHDVILKLASDQEEVAEPVLQYSAVLNDDDLAAIIHSTRSLVKLLAIAARSPVSERITADLIHTGESAVTQNLLENPHARFDAKTLNWLLEEYAQDDSILELMVHRAALPAAVAEKLFTLVSTDLQQQLSKRFELSVHLAEDLTSSAREISVMKFITPWMSQQDIQNLVNEMHSQKRLSDSMLIRSLCIGDLRFFKTAIARRAGISTHNAKLLLLDPGMRGFSTCYKRAGLPEDFCDAVYVLFKCAMEESEFGRYYYDQFTQRLIQRIVAEGFDRRVQHMTYIMTILRKTIQDAPTVH
jgi:uncharacterized protein (DUF2336 family)